MNRAILITFLGIAILPQVAQADLSVAPNRPINKPYQDLVGRDISQNGWSGWQTPVGTVDPGRLIPSDDSSNSVKILTGSLASPKSNSFELTGTFDQGKAIHIEKTKPIEEIEPKTADTAVNPVPVPIAVAAPRSDSRRIMLIAAGSVALLAFRKFRRTSNIPKKPNFL